MKSDTTLQGICGSVPISNAHHRRVLQLMAQEVKLATDEARSIAIEGARSEAERIVSEAKRISEEIILAAKQEAKQIISEAKYQVQAELKKVALHRAMSYAPPRGIPPLFVEAQDSQSSGRLMPVFWA
ncbi:hypothetical protein ACFLVF_03740 [Chloroflexota bacterium]